MKSTSRTVKHRGGLIMLWACVASSGTGNILLVKGRMDSIKYQPILEANITPSAKKIWKWNEDDFYNRIMILNTPQNPVDYIKRRQLSTALTVPGPKQHQKSVDRPQKSSSWKMVYESHRTSCYLTKQGAQTFPSGPFPAKVTSKMCSHPHSICQCCSGEVDYCIDICTVKHKKQWTIDDWYVTFNMCVCVYILSFIMKFSFPLSML